ncbi:MAG: methanogenesis marker 12 protein [Methanobacteriaceae archaeon]|nr:methanogenesis marker 12 protein [Methanobacteriaceae archaeon]
MVFVGMDHGTTGVSFTVLLEEPVHFKIGREQLSRGEVSAMTELAKRVELERIDLMAITYAMGDGISHITPLEKVKDRGILSIEGAGKVTGGGTFVYDEIEQSHIPTILIPGLHKNSASLDPRFRAAYSHQASAEKVSICYNAHLETGFRDFIVADISSNTVNILLEDAKIRGAMDACLGAMGIIHGPLDLEMIRNIDDGIKTANQCFSQAGAVKVAGLDEEVSHARQVLLEKYRNGDPKAKLALNTMLMTILMEIWGLNGISRREIEGVVMTGSIGTLREPYDFYGRLSREIENLGKAVLLPPTSGSMGSAQIARAVFQGKKDILGIKVQDF